MEEEISKKTVLDFSAGKLDERGYVQASAKPVVVMHPLEKGRV